MTERPFPPLPFEPAYFSQRVYTYSHMHDYVRADRAAQADAVAVLRELVEAWDESWEAQAVHKKFFAAVEAARELLAKENSK